MDTYKLILTTVFINLFVTIAMLAIDDTKTINDFITSENANIGQNISEQSANDFKHNSTRTGTTLEKQEDSGGFSTLILMAKIAYNIIGIMLIGAILGAIKFVSINANIGSPIFMIIAYGTLLLLSMINIFTIWKVIMVIKNRDTK